MSGTCTKINRIHKMSVVVVLQNAISDRLGLFSVNELEHLYFHAYVPQACRLLRQLSLFGIGNRLASFISRLGALPPYNRLGQTNSRKMSGKLMGTGSIFWHAAHTDHHGISCRQLSRINTGPCPVPDGPLLGSVGRGLHHGFGSGTRRVQ